ncbi:hypothetical protein ACYOEI_19690 [Singulisphaera rosea]
MTADEWDLCSRSDFMLMPLNEWLIANPGSVKNIDRKLRLYAVACCRLHWDLFEMDLFRQAVDVGERFADGQADERELATIYEAIMAFPTPNDQSHSIEEMTLRLASKARGMQCALSTITSLATATGWDDFELAVWSQAQRLRCIFGNPFRPVESDLIWRTPSIVGIAEKMYADRDFSPNADLGRRPGRSRMRHPRDAGSLPGRRAPHPWLLGDRSGT